MEKYFNDVLFKLPVTVTDLQAGTTGYAFELAFGVYAYSKRVTHLHNGPTKPKLQKLRQDGGQSQ